LDTMTDIEKSIQIIKKVRRTHELWIPWLGRHPLYDTSVSGDIEHHKEVIEEYDFVIATLKKLMTT